MTYIDGLVGLVRRKGGENGWRMVLHSDQGSVYASEGYNDLLTFNRIIYWMSRSGTLTDNAVIEAINGWLKEELFTDFHITERENRVRNRKIHKVLQRRTSGICPRIMTPKQYREEYMEEMFRNG